MAFGLQAILVKRGLASSAPLHGAVITVFFIFAFIACLSPWYMRSEYWWTFGFWIFALNGLLHPMASMYCAIQATSRTGPTVAATFSSTAPIFAAALAIGFLGETLTVQVAIGTLITVAGVIALSWDKTGFKQGLRTALLFATTAAVIRGANNVFSKYGLDYMPDVMMATFVSALVSVVGLSLISVNKDGFALFKTPPRAVIWFALSGTLGGTGIACMYSALQVGEVVIVAPIIGGFPLFTLLFGFILLREKVTRRIVFGCALILAGVTAVSTA